MITDKEAKNIAAKIRCGKDTHTERVAYERWSKVSKGRRPRTSLAELLAGRRKREDKERAANDLLTDIKRANPERFEARSVLDADTSAGFDTTYVKVEKQEPPIAPPLPLEGELVDKDPIAPPIDIPEPPPPGIDLGAGIAKGARAFLEKQDARNQTPEVGGIALTSILGPDFWSMWEAAAQRLMAEHVGIVKVKDDELVVGGAVAVVVQPVAIPYVKEHGAEWIEKVKRMFGFGGPNGA
jgi:hypothetical protein